MTLTVTRGTGSSTRTWSPKLPAIPALADSLPALAGVSLSNPAMAKRALRTAEPFVALAAEAAGLGLPELLVVVAAVAAAKDMLAAACRAETEPAPVCAAALRAETTGRSCSR